MEIVEAVCNIASFAVETGFQVGDRVVKAAPLNRECLVELCNDSHCYTLCNPSLHMRSGFCSYPLPLSLKPLTAGKALFSKFPVVARGTVGVFTYDFLDNTQSCKGKLAIMYKVPFDLNIKCIEYAVGVFDSNTQCDKQLFRKMSRETDQTFIKAKAKSSSLTHRGEALTVRATMSSCYTPIMKVQVSDNLDPNYEAPNCC